MTRYRKHGELIGLATAVLLAFGSTAADALLVDGFGDDQSVVATATSNPVVLPPAASSTITISDTDLSNVQRTLVATMTGANSAGLTITLEAANDILSFSKAAATAGSGTAIYDFDPVAMTGLDLAFRVVFSDLGGDLNVKLSDGTNDASQILSIASLVGPGFPTPGPVDYLLSLSSFSGINLSAVTGLEIEILGPASLDLQFDLVEAVPAPLPLGLIGMGLGAIGFLSRRRGTKTRQLSLR